MDENEDGDGDEEGDERDGERHGEVDGEPAQQMAQQLARLTKVGVHGGRVVSFSAKNVRRRGMRKGGPRDKVAELFTAVLRETNSARGLGSAPIRLEDGMEKMDEGQDLLARIASADRDRAMAEGARLVIAEAGRANKGQCWGYWPRQTRKGRVSIGDLSNMTGMSESYVAASRGAETTFGPRPASTFREGKCRPV